MPKSELVEIFNQMADILEILEEDPFRVNSYRKAGRVLENLSEPIEQLAEAGKLLEIQGIGKSTAEKIMQYIRTGRIDRHQELLAKIPRNLPGLLGVAGIGPKTAAKLWRQANITSVEELKQAVETRADELAELDGLGVKKIEQIAQALYFHETTAGRLLIHNAEQLARDLLVQVRSAGAQRASAAGSLRRGKETIGDIDLLCQAPGSSAGKIIESFAAGPQIKRVLAKGQTKCSVVLENGTQADLRAVGRAGYGAAMMYFTGSKDHNVALRELANKKGLKLNEYGLFKGSRRIAGANEEGIYKALGLHYIEPELREDRGEIELAGGGELPKVLKTDDIRGDLHVHTTASDGHNTIDEMIRDAIKRGYKYLGISDHSKSQIQAHGLDEKRMREHARAIRRSAERYPKMLVLVGVEVDIFKDGSLDFGDELLAELDFVVASPHSALSMKGADATKRFIKAIERPTVHCIGHASGRLINSRPGMELDIDAIAQAAAANNVALEINASPYRLDLRDTHVRLAISAGAKLIISTDAHSCDEMDTMRYGVITARRGWATKHDVINTLDADRLLAWLRQKRR